MEDLRYLEDKDKFLEYTFDVLKNHFKTRDEFIRYFDSIENDIDKNKFLKISSFYRFLVRKGRFVTDIGVVDYLDTTYKYVAIFSLIDALYDKDDYKEFYEWLRMNSSDILPIDDISKLDKLYTDYKEIYGSVRNATKFFTMLDDDSKSIIIKKIKVKREEKPLEYLAKLLYHIRSEFVHKARLIAEIKEGTVMSTRMGKMTMFSISLEDLMLIFERGLVIYFNN